MKTRMDRMSVGEIKKMMDTDGYDKTIHVLLESGGHNLGDGLTLIQFHDRKFYDYKMNEQGESNGQ